VDSHVPGAPFRLLSIRAPRQAGLRTSFRLAPSSYRTTLRSTGSEDARCDEPTSAIQSNHVHPHLVRSRLRAPLAERGHPTESLAPSSGVPGDRAFHDARDRFGGSSHDTCSVHLFAFPLWMHRRGRFLPTEPCATEPLTPLSRSFRRLPPLSSSRELLVGRASLHFTRIGTGRKTEGPPRPLCRASRERSTRKRSGMPSIVRDPS